MRFPPIDAFSFWLGFGVAALIGGLLFFVRGAIGRGREAVLDALRGLRDRLTSGTERNWREDVFRDAQTQHLAGSIFPLNDILLTPRCFVPDLPIDPERPPEDEDLNTAIPILPDWPDLAAVFRAPTLDIARTLTSGDHIVLLGGPGAGKTTALAHLASRAAQSDEALFPANSTPIFVHVGDLDLTQAATQDPAEALIAAAQSRASLLTAANLVRHLKGRLKRFHCVIFLDGFDDLPPIQVESGAGWLARFKQSDPTHRLIAAAATTHFAPLLQLGFAPLYLAPAAADDQRQLVTKWHAAWQAARTRSKKKPAPGDPDPHVLLGWLHLPPTGRTMLEVSLKLFGAFLGDARGSRPVDWLEAHVLRHGVTPNGQKALGRLGLALATASDQAGLPRAAARELAAPCFQLENGEVELDANAFLDLLITKRLLVKQGKDRINFRHALITAYCAATELAAQGGELPKPMPTTPLWPWVLYFLSALADVTSAVKHALTQPADLLYTDPLTCARWLRDAAPQAKWRGEVLKRLSQLMLNANLPEALRARALTGFVAAQDQQVSGLFKQALTSPDPYTRRSAALGLGALADGTAVTALTALLSDPYLDVRWAAALGLVAVGSEGALQALRQGLYAGDDSIRQACAQALARNADLGHEWLKEALKSDDLATRRAAIYGLAETGADWVVALLEDIRQKETQWVVRTAADSLATHLTSPAARAPQPVLPPEAQGWLVGWAAEHGSAVPPGRAAVEVLNRALREGAEPVRMAAAEALAKLADPSAASELYTALRDPEYPAVREAAYRGLAFVAAATGQRLSMPTTRQPSAN